MTGSIALPGMYQPRITAGVRIAVGEKRPDAKAPEKLDYIRLARWDPEVGAKGSYVQDDEAMRLLADFIGQQAGPDFKPVRVPVQFLYNLEMVPDPLHEGQERPEVPREVLWTRMARYAGSRCVCACEKFRLIDERNAEAAGIAWPPDPNKPEAWIGWATCADFTGKRKKTFRRVCHPATCEFAGGAAERATCKPQTVLRCVLPFMEALGVVAEYHTTSWQSTARLRGSLLEIGALNNGWLIMLGMAGPPYIELVMDTRRVSSEGYQAPILHAEYRGTLKALREATVETKRELVGLDAQIKAIGAGTEAPLALDDGQDAYAWSHEFSHETAYDSLAEVGIDATIRELATRARWSDAQLAARMAAHEEDRQGLVAELEEALGLRVPGDEAEGEAEASGAAVGYVDAEFEDREADAPLSDEALDEEAALEPPPLPDEDTFAEDDPCPDAPEDKAARAKTAGKPKRLIEE